METTTAESQRAQRNCIFPRIPERGILGKGPGNILKFYTFRPLCPVYPELVEGLVRLPVSRLGQDTSFKIQDT